MPDHRWLVLRLEAPLLAFGGVAVDQVGVTRDFPAASMLTGLFANALGYRRTEWRKHQALQDSLIFAARRERETVFGLLTDTQNAQLGKNDRGWTTWGTPEGRNGDSYRDPHRRRRSYHADACVVVALRVEPTDTAPDLETLATALDCPARPLFIGRKPCLPSMPLRQKDTITAPDAYAALQGFPSEQSAPECLRAIWPLGEGPSSASDNRVHRIFDLPDLRNWRTGLHGGARKVVEGNIKPERAAA